MKKLLIGIALIALALCVPNAQIAGHAQGGMGPSPGMMHSAVCACPCGPLSPGTVITSNMMNGAPNPSMTADWSNPNNVKVSDNIYAVSGVTGSGDEATYFIYASNFGFGIGAAKIIDGILVEVECKQNSGSGFNNNYMDLQLDSVLDDDYEQTIGTLQVSDTYNSVGGPTDTIGAPLTPALVNSGEFGPAVFFSGSLSSAAVDHIRMTVYCH